LRCSGMFTTGAECRILGEESNLFHAASGAACDSTRHIQLSFNVVPAAIASLAACAGRGFADDIQ